MDLYAEIIPVYKLHIILQKNMFKSASTRQFQNAGLATSSNLDSSNYDSRSRGKKMIVKFEIEKDKENNNQKQEYLEKPQVQKKDKYQKIWTHKMIPSEDQYQKCQGALKESKGSKVNLNTQFPNEYDEDSQIYLSPTYQATEGGYSAKKNISCKKFTPESPKFQISYKQCKSLKILPSYNPDEQSLLLSSAEIKRQRKFPKFQAYNQLLKTSQNLIQKYRKLQQEKSKLKSDLKVQIQIKSTKKIIFLQQNQSQKKYSKTQSQYYPSIEVKSPKRIEYTPSQLMDYSVNLQKFRNQPNHQSKYESQLNKSSYSPGYNKKFTFQSSTYLIQTTSPSNLKFPSKFVSSNNNTSASGSSKSSSTNKISSVGLSLQEFQLGKCLGSGAFGEVFQAKHKETGWLFAIKKVKKQKVKHMLDQFIQQIKIQLFLDHPNIVKLYSFFYDQLHFYTIMQYMQGGSLYSQIKKKKTLSLEQTSQKLKQVCQGIKHIHDNQIVHRDIKPQNIVLSHNVPKLCDFGWSTICKDRRTTYCGTLDYISPQIIEGDGYDDSVDVWCVGVLAYQLLVGRTPFYNISRKQTMKKIIDCDLDYPSKMPEVAVNFVKRILKKNPDHRNTIEEVLKDPMFDLAQNQNNII